MTTLGRAADRPAHDSIRTLVVRPLRYGTAAAVAVIAIGLLAGLDRPVEIGRDRLPLLEVASAGGALAILAIGLLLLCLVPLAVALGAAGAFAGRRERRYLAGSLVVIALLAASLLVPAFLLAPS